MVAEKDPARLTIDALRYYVPLYQQGDAAEQRLLAEGDTLSPAERNHLEALLRLKNLIVDRVSALAAPLIIREINKLISTSHLRGREDIFDLLYYAGIDGMKRGLRRFEVEKMNASSTNYLFQWIVTYAKKELVVLEAPFGIPPSRFQRYKKISAVRKKLTEQLGRYATNEEVLDYFASGKADLVTMNGRVRDKGKPSQANQNITLDLIIEQEVFEREMLSVELLDPLEDYSAEAHLSSLDEPPFSETVFGVFTHLYPVTPVAQAVLMSELNAKYLDEEQVRLLKNLSPQEHKSLSTQWKNLVKDVHGPFYEFLQQHQDEQFSQFDVRATMRAIEHYGKRVNGALYQVLFEKGIRE